MKWRVIKPKPYSAYMNHALGDSLTHFVGKGNSPPTIRFAEYWPPAVSIGVKQKIREVVNLEECQKLGINVVRRGSAGGAVYLKKDMALSAIIIAPHEYFHRDVDKNYRELYDRIIKALEKFGIKANFKRPNDLIVEGKKICGGVQYQTPDCVFVAGTMLYIVDKETMSKVLNENADEKVTSIKEHAKVSKATLIKELTKALTEDKNYYFGEITEEEMSKAKELAEKYKKKEWIFKK